MRISTTKTYNLMEIVELGVLGASHHTVSSAILRDKLGANLLQAEVVGDGIACSAAIYEHIYPANSMKKPAAKKVAKKRAPRSPRITADPKLSSGRTPSKPTVTLTLDELDQILDFEIDDLLGPLFKIKRPTTRSTHIRWIVVIAVECLLLGFVLAHLW